MKRRSTFLTAIAVALGLRPEASVAVGSTISETAGASSPGAVQADHTRWTLLQGEHDGHPLLTRYREFAPGYRRAAFPHRINIFWTMAEPDANGLATTAEAARLERFENRLVEAVEHDELAVLSVALTCNGKREFVFHTANVGSFGKRLNEMPQEAQRYPIMLVHAKDAAWAYDDSLVLPENRWLQNEAAHAI